MGFKESDEAMGKGMFLTLSDDGDTATVKLMGESDPRKGSFKGKPRMQFVFPVVSEDGLQVWTVGTKRYKKIRDNWKAYSKGALRITRHGVKNDTQTVYDMKPVALSKAMAGYIKEVSAADVAEIMEPPADVPEQDADGIPI